MGLKRDLTLKYESHIYHKGSWKARRPESLEAKNISFHQAFRLPGFTAFQPFETYELSAMSYELTLLSSLLFNKK
jgi:hypothetical protein